MKMLFLEDIVFTAHHKKQAGKQAYCKTQSGSSYEEQFEID